MTASSFWIPAAVAATGAIYAGVVRPNVHRLPTRLQILGRPAALWVCLVIALALAAVASDSLGY